jgi:quinol monooxygenase YgiN
MSTTFVARLVVRPGQEARLEALQRELSELTHATEPGTVVYDVIKHRTEPSTYVVYGRFKDEAAFQLHMNADSHARLVPDILASLASDMDLQFFDWIA